MAPSVWLMPKVVQNPNAVKEELVISRCFGCMPTDMGCQTRRIKEYGIGKGILRLYQK